MSSDARKRLTEDEKHGHQLAMELNKVVNAADTTSSYTDLKAIISVFGAVYHACQCHLPEDNRAAFHSHVLTLLEQVMDLNVLKSLISKELFKEPPA